MTENEALLISVLQSYMSDSECDYGPSRESVSQLINLAIQHKVTPIVFLKLKDKLRNVCNESDFSAMKKDIILQTSLQIIKESKLAVICRMFDENKIGYILYKGAVCRNMYSCPEYRISADEDFLVKEEDLKKAEKLLSGIGFVEMSIKTDEIKMINPTSALLLELHTNIIGSNDTGSRKINSLFKAQIGKNEYISCNGQKIWTFSPTYNLLVLILHLLNHFITGGVGVRQLMDIARFVDLYGDSIDFAYIKNELESVSACTFFEAVMYLCKKYFAIEYDVAFNDGTAERLIDDMLESGIYGGSLEYRKHSGTMTKKMVREKSSVFQSAFSAIFPNNDIMKKKYPVLEEKPEKMFLFRIKRILSFVSEKDGYKAYITGRKRKKLLNELKIIS